MTAGAPHLRPLGIGEVLDVALKIVWRNAGTLLRVVVFVVLPVQIVSTLILVSATSSVDTGTFGTTGSQVHGSDVATFIVAALAAVLLGFLGSTLASGACFRAIASAYLGERTSWRSSLRFALRHLHSIVWITFLAGLASGLGLILCVIPGIYLWVGFSLAVPALLTESKKGRRALGRSRELVRGYWWRTFAVTLLGYLLSSILGGAIQGVVAGVTNFSSSTDLTSVVLAIVAGTISKLVTTPFIAAFVTVLYFDLRVRKEGFDLQLLAERIGVDPPPGGVLPPPPPSADAGDEPPFWPPPPGWKPGGGAS